MLSSRSGAVFARALTGFLVTALTGPIAGFSFAEDIQFNTEVLDLEDRSNIDLGQFARGNYIMPGEYEMTVRINKEELPEHKIAFRAAEGDAGDSLACLSPELVEEFGLKPDATAQLKWSADGQCLDLASLPGATARGDLSAAALYVEVPQAFLEYTSENWDPPSRWDDGISGLVLDYNFNAQSQHLDGGQNSNDISGNGVFGANLGAWRVRADWQARYDDRPGSQRGAQLDWSRYYAYRAIPSLGAKLTVGENYLTSSIFDSFRFAGASLATDDNMLPPNLRGYAPEVTGVARTNAKVTVSQQGRVLYETQVAPGPFRIQDINEAVQGQLDVRVEEQDGSVQEFKMDTADVPYLTRPGTVRYKFSAGRPSDWDHHIEGPAFGAGEFSWGVSNGWSLYGGGLGGEGYTAAAIGIGRDLMQFGALSFDVTQSSADLEREGRLSGRSYRISYSKSFDELDSQVTFAGYRFSERDYMTMSDYLSALEYGQRGWQNSKEMYTVMFNQQFRELGLSAYLNYGHQTYWGQQATDNYSLSLSRYFDAGRFKNLSVSFTASRSTYNGIQDDSYYVSLSMPWDGAGSVSYSSSVSNHQVDHQLSYYDRIGDHDSYQVSAGTGDNGHSASGYLSHRGDAAEMNFSASYQEGRYSTVAMSVQGGATATLQGAALHRTGVQGGTRILLDTDGVPGVPVHGYGETTETNHFGKAVVADISSYYRNRLSIDLDGLPDDAEAIHSVTQATLTEGAIGYRHFDVVAGQKAMVVVHLPDGSAPPFGATVANDRDQAVGIVSDAGSLYLSGIQPGGEMTLSWDGEQRCKVHLPQHLPSIDHAWPLDCMPMAVAAKNHSTGQSLAQH